MPRRKTNPETKRKTKKTQTSPESEYLVVLTTCGSRREAVRIARTLVAERLAACVNISAAPWRSIYRWKGKIEQADEFLLLIKTSRSRQAALQARVLSLHSYETPEFLAVPVTAGSAAYLAWLEDCLGRPLKL